jgi:preprotein translocase subunit SecE
MGRVTWPSSKEVYATTFVVILVSTIFGLYLFGLDVGLNWIMTRVFQQFGGA